MSARQPVWRTSKLSNILTLISQHSYQIRRKSRWHLVGTDKTYLQYKNLRESPTDNRDMGEVPYKLIGTSVNNRKTNNRKILEPMRIVNL